MAACTNRTRKPLRKLNPKLLQRAPPLSFKQFFSLTKLKRTLLLTVNTSTRDRPFTKFSQTHPTRDPSFFIVYTHGLTLSVLFFLSLSHSPSNPTPPRSLSRPPVLPGRPLSLSFRRRYSGEYTTVFRGLGNGIVLSARAFLRVVTRI